MISVELGGGTRGRQGYANVDLCDGADVRLDLETVGRGQARLPWGTGEVAAVYSSHCFEHVQNLHGLWHEVARITCDGGPVEIRVPHWGQSMAMCAGHHHTLSDRQILHLYQFPVDWWGDAERWLVLRTIQYVRGANFDEASQLFPHLTPLQVVRFVQDTCHELRCHFIAEPRGRTTPEAVLAAVQHEVI